MLVCLGSAPEMSGYARCVDIASFSRNVLDSEATGVVCHNFLSRFYYNEIPQVWDIILKKMRIGSDLEIVEPDIDMISKQVFREEVDLQTVNSLIFHDKDLMKSLINLEFIESLVPENFKVISKYYGPANFSIKIKRVQ